MIFRRIIQSFRDQAWSVLIAELIVLVIGVFLGIQVSNWNDDRLDALKSHDYLARIHADLEADIQEYENRAQFWQQVFKYGQTGLGYAARQANDDASDWQILLAYFQASQLAAFFTSSATYEELKSGGELGLIPDTELRKVLSNYYTNADNPTLSERPNYRVSVRGIIPIDIQVYIWENCWESNEYGKQVLIDCASPLPINEAAALLEIIRSDEQLMSDLRYWVSTMRVALFMVQDRKSFAMRISQMIKDLLLEMDSSN